MSDDSTPKGNDSGPTWKFWATIGFSIIGTLLGILCGLYVSNVGKQFKNTALVFQKLASKQQELDRKINRLGVKMFGAAWLEGKSLDNVEPVMWRNLKQDQDNSIRRIRVMRQQIYRLHAMIQNGVDTGSGGIGFGYRAKPVVKRGRPRPRRRK